MSNTDKSELDKILCDEYLTNSTRRELEEYIAQQCNQARIDERNKGHWYAGGFGRDANGFEVGYKCNCGFKASNKSTIHSHVDWKKAELQAQAKETEGDHR
ncbi:hypothetical protein [Arthrobacter sp. EpRS71]|uniref:hypothetical protein n=1 Tax=Arthrobacter sp. EpRS71 TaxID=1743141 RepID=UPI000A8A6CD7|nr:hypothetical protein [Arthrobacter sp. EpRS71]